MSARVRRAGCAAAVWLLLVSTGCEEGAETPAAPAPAPVEPTPAPTGVVKARFTAERVEVQEGGAVEIGIEFAGTDLAEDVTIEVLAAEGGPNPDEYELSVETLPVPAGEGVEGTTQLRVNTAADDSFSEGVETLVLSLAVAEGTTVDAEFGDPVEIAIADAGAFPCPGVAVRSEPWRQQEWRSSGVWYHLATTLTLEVSGGGIGAALDLRSPYLEYFPGDREPWSYAAFGINGWRVEPTDGGYRHTVDLNWPGEAFVDAVFREVPDEEDADEAPPEPLSAPLEIAFVGGSCSGTAVASCTEDGCELLP